MIFKTKEEKLMEYLKCFTLTDLVGFAKIVHVDTEIIRKALIKAASGKEGSETEEWENFICTIVENFLEEPRQHRRELLKIAKQIKECNEEDGVNG